MKLLNYLSIVLVGLCMLAAGCAEQDSENEMNEADSTMTESRMSGQNAMNNSASATLSPTEGNKAEGKVTFMKVGNAVRVEGEFSGLSSGMHGFHIHQNGDCSASDASSAGGHFNPGNNDHGARTDSVRHMGDLGNIEAGSNGNATVSLTDSVLVLNQIMGKAVIVHSGEDDLTSQPSGAAGSRVACGVIEGMNAQSDSTMNSGSSDY